MPLTKKQRRIFLPKISSENFNISANSISAQSREVSLDSENSYFVTQTDDDSDEDEFFYHFPVLLEADGGVWYEGTHFLFHLCKNIIKDYSPSKISRKASNLLDYKIWCENNNVDMFKFTARRPQNRPSYCYFKFLLEKGISPGNLNQKMSIVYNFTVFYSNNYQIDIARIDQVTDAFLSFKNDQGQNFTKKIKKHKSRAKVTKRKSLNINNVLDDGEALRPLFEDEQKLLVKALSHKRYAVDERLIFQFTFDTGARKQTVLTLRRKHVKQFTPEYLSSDGTYKISAGQGSDVDTKFDRPQTISIPESLAEQIKIYINSPIAKKRFKKFKESFGELFENEDDIYVFIGKRGDCRYMAKNDPRYLQTKNPPIGGSIQSIINRLYKHDLPSSFPQDYKFHWGRATFAYNYHIYLQPLVDEGKITFEDQISFIQDALGHSDPTTTLNYLKLFTGNKTLTEMQTVWEDRLFNLSIFDKFSNTVEK
ncbi:MAG: integrase [Psychroserpens sp.]|jgi:integrase